ncbi:hypothetical protein SAMN02745244_00402 [Tessaracoccus bendigoensis DSM 12906]|uniref:Uncharacterized protein n=1 Tax=Tessaracoccus bendigoensis DSM 12906 TaxID=1123357 RepID=A0A1M6BB03_9ACTN|nr:hypothetical protein SAMN02745244_00402 [Tessaracoccus bendigoensis DSM 12906]
MKRLWGRNVATDLLGGVLGAIAFFLPGAVLAKASEFASAGSAVISIMAALVTFACGMVYQSQAPATVRMRAHFGRELRGIWSWVVTVVLLCALAALIAIPVAAASETYAWVIALGAVGVSTLATLRAIGFIRTVLIAEAIDPKNRPPS